MSDQTAFEDDDATSAAQYAKVMKSGEPILVFGTGYGSVTLDSNSVTTGQATNPASKLVTVIVLGSTKHAEN